MFPEMASTIVIIAAEQLAYWIQFKWTFSKPM